MDYSPPRLLCPWDFQARILEWVAISSSRGFAQPREQTHVSCICLAGRFFTTEPSGKPKFLLESITTQTAGGGRGRVGVIREGVCIIPS